MKHESYSKVEDTLQQVFEEKRHGVQPQNGIPGFLCITKLGQPTGQTFFSIFPKEFSHFFQTYGSHRKVCLENAKKKWYYEKWVGRHASFPPRQYVKQNCRNFSVLPKRPGLPRQLKTHIAFSIFLILGANLCLKIC